jgi:hypothetical protein
MENIKDTELTELVGVLTSIKNDPNIVKLLRILDIYVEKWREENDTVDIDELKTNQGKIQAYKELANLILHGLPQFKPNAPRPLPTRLERGY